MYGKLISNHSLLPTFSDSPLNVIEEDSILEIMENSRLGLPCQYISILYVLI